MGGWVLLAIRGERPLFGLFFYLAFFLGAGSFMIRYGPCQCVYRSGGAQAFFFLLILYGIAVTNV